MQIQNVIYINIKSISDDIQINWNEEHEDADRFFYI